MPVICGAPANVNGSCAVNSMKNNSTIIRAFFRRIIFRRIVFRRIVFRTVLALLLTAAGACTFLQDMTTRLPGPRLYEKGAEVIDGIRGFERRIGFRETDNFQDVDHETESYPFCGFSPAFYLPYSYQDPAIRWIEVKTVEECREEAGEGTDVYFDQTEALGESGTPVTPSMLSGTLVRFVYLVLHEDCHDQFDLPFGIEEPLCNVITYHAMDAYAVEKDRFSALERVALRRYAVREPERTRQAKGYYEQLESAYGRYSRREISRQAAVEERAKIFAAAERTLAWPKGALNNVGIANDMTYSRHYPYLESVYIALDRDLGRTVAFFRQVDRAKPSRAVVIKRLKVKDDKNLEFIRAYEAAVLETIEKELAGELRR